MLFTNHNTLQKVVWRAGIVLATANGSGTYEIMRRENASKPTVWRRKERDLDQAVAGLGRGKTRPFWVPPLPQEASLRVITLTVQKTPTNGTYWSRSAMAKMVGISPSSAGPIWEASGLKPHLARMFKVSNDPMFEESVAEIIGLFLDPPETAVVHYVDADSQIQALDRTQHELPQKIAHATTKTQDCKRHGTTTLFAALEMKSGMVIGGRMLRHLAGEFLTFLRHIDRGFGKPCDIHFVLDYNATHKMTEVKARLATLALQVALHADQCVLDEPRGTLLRRDQNTMYPPGKLLQRRRPRDRDPRPPATAQHQAIALPLDQDGRLYLHPRTPRAGQTR